MRRRIMTEGNEIMALELEDDARKGEEKERKGDS